MWRSSNGAVKLGQPVPDSNFVPDTNSGSPHRRHTYTPSLLLCSSPPQKARSVPCSRMTCRSSGVRSAARRARSDSESGLRS
jgi:hypothetical protein